MGTSVGGVGGRWGAHVHLGHACPTVWSVQLSNCFARSKNGTGCFRMLALQERTDMQVGHRVQDACAGCVQDASFPEVGGVHCRVWQSCGLLATHGYGSGFERSAAVFSAQVPMVVNVCCGSGCRYEAREPANVSRLTNTSVLSPA